MAHGPIRANQYHARRLQVHFLVVESTSRWPEAFPLKTQHASEIADVLYNEVFCRYGAPRSLLSDRGQNFVSHLVTELCKLFNVKRLKTSSFRPQTNSQCENFNQNNLEVPSVLL